MPTFIKMEAVWTYETTSTLHGVTSHKSTTWNIRPWKP